MTHTTHPWTASWAENGIATLRDSEGNHFANFRNVRGDEISTVNADLAVVVAAPAMQVALSEIARELARHPDAQRGNSTVHFSLMRARAFSPAAPIPG